MRKNKILLPINLFHTQPFYKKRCAQSKITSSEKKRDGQKETCVLRSLHSTYTNKDTMKRTNLQGLRRERDEKRDKTNKEKRER